jgi:hypothetical protein
MTYEREERTQKVQQIKVLRRRLERCKNSEAKEAMVFQCDGKM